jgi:DNA polymerase
MDLVIDSNNKSKLLASKKLQLANCKSCPLHEKRTNMVYGEGDENARLMFIGEGPGEKEDLSGRPFVGAAGKLLDKIILAMHLQREEVYIANIVKCRPPGNRTPLPIEMSNCFPNLQEQIAIINPRVIVALGSPAAKTLLQTENTISKLRGNWYKLENIDLMPTFHPSYLLRNPVAKKDVWEDMKQVMQHLNL